MTGSLEFSVADLKPDKEMHKFVFKNILRLRYRSEHYYEKWDPDPDPAKNCPDPEH
jgi:hypothetical protein